MREGREKGKEAFHKFIRMIDKFQTIKDIVNFSAACHVGEREKFIDRK